MSFDHEMPSPAQAELEERVAREIEEDLARGRTFRTNPPPASRTEYRAVNHRTVYVDGMPREIHDLQRVNV